MSKFVRTVRVKRLQYVSQAKLIKTLQCRIVNQEESEPGQSHLKGRLSPVVYKEVKNGIQQPNSKNMARHTSIFQAKIYAITTRAEVNLMKGYINQGTYINSKSGVTLLALASVYQTSRVMKNYTTFLNTREKKNNLVLHWIPGHSVSEGNVVPEKLTKAEVKEVFIGPEPFNRTSHSLAKLIFRDQCIEASQDIWLEANGLVHSKVLIYSTKHCRETLALSENFRILPLAFTEHCGWNVERLNMCLPNIKLSKSRDCRFYHEADESPLHRLSHCCPQIGLRNSLMGRHVPRPEVVKIIRGENIILFINIVGLGSEL